MLHHVAICQKDKEKSKIFFTNILSFKIEKEFILDSALAKKIFLVDENDQIEVIHYRNENLMIEVFISEKHFSVSYFQHICLYCDKHANIISKCKEYNLKYTYIERDELVDLLFIYDFDGNRYEFFEIN